MEILDQKERLQALDINTSFLVQAPAGSGKTELLSQRFLSALAYVKNPESIVAITFTKKAQSEMHRRIIDALKDAKDNPKPKDLHKQQTYMLAKKALNQDIKYNWQLINNPERLNITTIDAFCLKLTKSMPEKSTLLTNALVASDIDNLYREAIDALLADMSETHPKYPSLSNVLNHLANNLEAFYELVMNMLKVREQWLSLLFDKNYQDLRDYLEDGFVHLIQNNLNTLHHLLSPYLNELEALAFYALDHLDGSLASFDKQTLEPKLSNLPLWQFVINHFFLTKTNTLRKRVQKGEGFPTDSKNKEESLQQKEKKRALLSILEAIASSDNSDQFLTLFNDLKSTQLSYDDSQWQILSDIIEILILATQYLKMTFSYQNEVDFTEIALNALTALGNSDTPSDLMLYLDYKIEHLLIDEFQDTSKLQYHLVKALTSGWQDHDGHSLFLVGDPMQSIYRFRQAEVELFLNAADGIGDISLQKLNLKCNFRSSQTIINWVNDTFKAIFPKENQKELGAIAYSASSGILDNPKSTISLYTIDDDLSEAMSIIEIIKAHKNDNPSCHFGILARNRSHLTKILQTLKSENLPYNETEIDLLYNEPIIEDLLSLTESILYPYEKLSITKLLSSRLFGLNLDTIEQLLTLFFESDYQSFGIFLTNEFHTLLDQPELFPILEKLQLSFQQLKEAQNKAFKQPINLLIRNLWSSLNGFCYYDEHAQEDAEYFFDLIEIYESEGHLVDLSTFQLKLETLRSSKTQGATIDVMTIHKSKGLEFDVVILPGLNKRTKGNTAKLLNYDYYHDHQGHSHLLLSAKSSVSDTTNSPIYNLISDTHHKRLDYELTRLLYVAVTRAKSHLYCFSELNLDDLSLIKVKKNTFLDKLYPNTKDKWQPYPLKSPISSQKSSFDQGILPLPTQLIALNRPPLIPFKEKEALKDNFPESFDYFALEGQIIGNTVHFLLEKLTKQKAFDQTNLNQLNLEALVIKTLYLQGATKIQILQLKDTILKAIQTTFNNKKIIDFLQKSEALYSEYNIYELTNYQKSKVKESIIDLLIQKPNNEIILIDYKTSKPANDCDIEIFLQEEKETYQNQLNHYKYLVSRLFKPKTLEAYLYFPMVDRLLLI